ncbi:Domain of uncharacterised function (DUF2825) [Cellulomonas fimi]|nr:Domain of uncharacterised function (DUF2825) [Cellulomonas fimi]
MSAAARVWGSSPHAGRRRVHRPTGAEVVRLIPARGETTPASGSRSTACSAHPRTRGDDTRGWLTGGDYCGSSPHAGRRPVRPRVRRTVAGLIPARGETTASAAGRGCAGPAHPRTRGDDPDGASSAFSIAGSSPHAGRRRLGAVPTRLGVGLIPARGETTVDRCGHGGADGAHPRTRGDDKCGAPRPWNSYGSSPHAGRRHRRPATMATTTGLIPARGETTSVTRPPRRRRRAHPRTRGDDSGSGASPDPPQGSSPHAGRRLRTLPEDAAHDGLIPARGETTSSAWSPRGSPRAHPRTRGDDLRRVTDERVARGSSPHAGRRRGRARRRARVVRLIPARGETTRTHGYPRARRRAHPRTRGDDRWSHRPHSPSRGSSPHAGRRLLDEAPDRLEARLIPARGETTRPRSTLRTVSRAHPRTRGDDHGWSITEVIGRGSSPHAGRRRPADPQGRRGVGLIPARGETTTGSGRSRSAGRAHPRTRGDDYDPHGEDPDATGSSPHAGRRRARRCRPDPRPGLIPARGETTRHRRPAGPPNGAHPRTRGDDWRVDREPHRLRGSSPHAGRRLLCERSGGLVPGLIPARGETTNHGWGRAIDFGAHPRTRGDDAVQGGRIAHNNGSSPHAGRRRGLA